MMVKPRYNVRNPFAEGDPAKFFVIKFIINQTINMDAAAVVAT